MWEVIGQIVLIMLLCAVLLIVSAMTAGPKPDDDFDIFFHKD